MKTLYFNLHHDDYYFMFLQFGLIVCVLLGWARRLRWPEQPSLSACLLALTAGWAFRLAGLFVLVSLGYNYLQSDDPCRWMLAHSWLRWPRFATGIWLPGGSALHGLAMSLVSDPLAATKLVAVLFCLLSLAGIFIFTLGAFDDRRLACAAVLAAAPQWLLVVLSSGAMSEMPVVAFMLTAGGLLLIGLRKPAAGRIWWLAAAALLFNLGTSFHTTAWMQLAAILITLFVYALTRGGRAAGFNVRHWLIFSLASSIFCIGYFAACWRFYGDPFGVLKENSARLLGDFGQKTLAQRLYAYPLSVVFTHRAVMPLLAFGIIWGWFARRGERRLRRGILLTGVLTLLILIATTLGGSVSGHGYRSTIVLSTALIPFMLAPFFPLPGDPSGAAQTALAPLNRSRKLVFSACAIASVYFFLSLNYRYTMERIDNFGTDATAVGTWLREEMIHPQVLKPRDLDLPVRIYIPEGVKVNTFPLIYEARFLDRIELDRKATLETLLPGQVVVSPVPIKDPRVRYVTQIGTFTIYRFQRIPAELKKPAPAKAGKPKGK